MSDDLPTIVLCESSALAAGETSGRIVRDFKIDVFGRPINFAISFADRRAKLTDLVPMAQSLCTKLVTSVVRDSRAAGYNITCRRGCSNCCDWLVPLSIAEAFWLKDQIAAVPTGRREVILHSFLAKAKRILGCRLPDNLDIADSDNVRLQTISDWYREFNLSCPFLSHNICTIYGERPLVCRECIVTSDSCFCKTDSRSEPEAVSLPVSIAEVLANVSSELANTNIEAVILPLCLAWCDVNSEVAAKTWRAAALVEQFIECLQQKVLDRKSAVENALK